MKTLKYIIITLCMISIYSCGEGTVEVENISYEPKIVIEGYLIPHHKVDKIKITRNFKLNEDLTKTSLIPDVNRTTVTITDLQNSKTYPLTFHIAPDNKLENYYWQYNENDLFIEYGRSYKIDVFTNIDEKALHASAVTTVPEEGFEIRTVNHSELKFRQLDDNNQPLNFKMMIQRSPGTTFYVTTIKALNASKHNFIYNNPYSNPDSSEVEDHLVDWSYTYDWTQDTPETAGQTEIEMFWPYFLFYTDYEIITLACDKNYKEFLQTYNNVQEEDGNFHEAKFNIQGDGIGVFGSVVTDTVLVRVIP